MMIRWDHALAKNERGQTMIPPCLYFTSFLAPLFTFLTAVLSFTFADALPAGAGGINPNARNLCAKPFGSLSSPELNVLGKLIAPENIKNGTGIWPTRTIPVVFHESLTALAKQTITKALKHVSDIGGIKFMQCAPEVALSDEKIRQYIIMLPISRALCKPDRDGCAMTGFIDKLKETTSKKDEEKVIIRGLRYGLKPPDDQADATRIEDVAVHELLHALGAKHQHQNPAAKNYIAIGVKDPLNCGTEGDGRPWMNFYDPGSIMHYDIGTVGWFKRCKITLKGCTVKPDRGARELLSKCKLEAVIAQGHICAYKAPGAKPILGSRCFQLPSSQFKGGNYGGSDFDLEKKACLSVLDQAWLRANYKDQSEDKFELAAKCTAL
jgi:hypothetical protein